MRPKVNLLYSLSYPDSKPLMLAIYFLHSWASTDAGCRFKKGLLVIPTLTGWNFHPNAARSLVTKSRKTSDPNCFIAEAFSSTPPDSALRESMFSF